MILSRQCHVLYTSHAKISFLVKKNLSHQYNRSRTVTYSWQNELSFYSVARMSKRLEKFRSTPQPHWTSAILLDICLKLQSDTENKKHYRPVYALQYILQTLWGEFRLLIHETTKSWPTVANAGN